MEDRGKEERPSRGRGRGWWKPREERQEICNPELTLGELFAKVGGLELDKAAAGVQGGGPTILQQEETFEDAESSSEIVSAEGVVYPKLPLKTVLTNERYFVEKAGEMKLLTHHQLKVNIRCVDEHDVFHVRVHVDPSLPTDIRPSAPINVEKMQERLHGFYTNPMNKVTYAYGQGGWIPVPGEVIVVRLTSQDHFININSNYRRARLVEIIDKGVTRVELLDDYGAGRVLTEAIYRIKPCWAKFAPQVFPCELARIGLFESRKVVHKILKSHQILDVGMDSVFEMSFHGEISRGNRPCVTLMWKSKGTQMCFKEHILQHLSILGPYDHLAAEGAAECVAIRGDEEGYLWVQFKKDNRILKRMSYMLQKLRPKYEAFAKLSQLCQADIFGPDSREDAKTKTYLTLVQDGVNVPANLRRVKILKCESRKEVSVESMDYGKRCTVDFCTLVPLSVLCPELDCLPAMVTRVHLNFIKSLEVNNEIVKGMLFGGETRLALACGWPKELQCTTPPDVVIFPSLTSDQKAISFMRQSQSQYSQYKEKAKPTLSGHARFFVERGLATAYSDEEMEASYSRIEETIQEVKKSEVSIAGRACSFSGKVFEFA